MVDEFKSTARRRCLEVFVAPAFSPNALYRYGSGKDSKSHFLTRVMSHYVPLLELAGFISM